MLQVSGMWWLVPCASGCILCEPITPFNYQDNCPMGAFFSHKRWMNAKRSSLTDTLYGVGFSVLLWSGRNDSKDDFTFSRTCSSVGFSWHTFPSCQYIWSENKFDFFFSNLLLKETYDWKKFAYVVQRFHSGRCNISPFRFQEWMGTEYLLSDGGWFFTLFLNQID